MEKEEEEKLRAKVIEKLSVISEHWDEDISQSLMVSPFKYKNASELCIEGLGLWLEALKLLKKLESNKIFIVYNQQRWDAVRLIKGYENKYDAEVLCKSLNEKETEYDEVYHIEEVEIEKMR